MDNPQGPCRSLQVRVSRICEALIKTYYDDMKPNRSQKSLIELMDHTGNLTSVYFLRPKGSCGETGRGELQDRGAICLTSLANASDRG